MIGKIILILLIVFAIFVILGVLAICKASGEASKKVENMAIHNTGKEITVGESKK